MTPTPTALPASPTLLSYQWVLFALCLWREARGCSHQEKLAIGHVIVNRATYPKPGLFPKTISGVITQPIQFTSIAPPVHITPAEMMNATTWPKDGDQQFLECCQIPDAFSTASEGADPTHGAVNYYSDPIPSVPAWAIPANQTAHIGVFHFFKPSN